MGTESPALDAGKSARVWLPPAPALRLAGLMAGGAASTERLLEEAYAALDGPDAHTAQQILAGTARALAAALSGKDSVDWNGEALGSAQSFLVMIADLLGGPEDQDWWGEDFAFVATLKKRPSWRPMAKQTPAEKARRAAAVRVYDLMADEFLDTNKPPKQEAAVATVMAEFKLPRSKVMKGLQEYRLSALIAGAYLDDGDGEWMVMSDREEIRRNHRCLAQKSLSAAKLRRNIGDRNIDDSSVTGRT